jgi:hypothetical protein
MEHTKLSHRLRIKPETRDKKSNRLPAHSTYAIPWYQCLRDNAKSIQQNDTKKSRGDEPASDPANTALTKLTPSNPLSAVATDGTSSFSPPDDVKALNKASRRQLAKQLLAQSKKYEKAVESLQKELSRPPEDLNASSDVAEKAHDTAREAADAAAKSRSRPEAIWEAIIAVRANMAAARALVNELMECDEVDESDEDEYDERDDIDE